MKINNHNNTQHRESQKHNAEKKPEEKKKEYKLQELQKTGETIVLRDRCSDGKAVGKGNYHKIQKMANFWG